MGLSARLDRWQRRHPRFGFPLAVIYKFGDDLGNYLAGTITYYAFVALLPMALLATTVLGIILIGHESLREQLVSSAVEQLPGLGTSIADLLANPRGLTGGVSGVVIGFLGALYGSLGAAQAFQYAANTVWQVPRNSRPNPFAARMRSLVLLASVGVGLLTIIIASQVLEAVLHVRLLGSLVLFLATCVLNTGVFMLAFRLGTARAQSLRTMLPGAVFAGVGLRLLQLFGATFVDRVISHASTSNAIFAGVLGLMAYLYLASMLVILAMEINVVRARRLWPRSLLTPFTDRVLLTAADERAYAGQAHAARAKGFEEIEVSFGESPLEQEPTAEPSPDQGE